MPKSSPDSPPPSAGRGVLSDYAAARQALAHQVRPTAVLAIGGPDRIDFLQGQLTQDVTTLAIGQSRPAAGLTPKGKLIYWGRVLAQAEAVLLLIPSRALAAVAAHLAKYAVFQKVTVRDATAEHLDLGLYGPGASAFHPPPGSVTLPAEGEFAAGLFAPANFRNDVMRELEKAGSRQVSEEIAEVLRVEAGRPLLGRDADETNLPEEVGLSAAISATKGCYVGQEIVARLRTYGKIQRRLVGFRFPVGPVPAGTVFPNPEKPDHEWARVTSAVASPRLGSIGLGIAFRDVVEGFSLSDASAPERMAVVVSLPFA